MKRTVILLAAMFGVTFSNAQKISEKEVPATVKSALQKNYPNAKDIKWEKEKGDYEAGFEVAKQEYSVLINTSGNILETEVEIEIKALPAKAKEYLSKNYAGQKIKGAAKITKANGEVNYEAEVKGKDIIFDTAGNFIKEDKD